MRHEKQEKMISVSKEHNWSFACEGDNTYKILIKKINPKYFSRVVDFQIAYEIFFEDLVDTAYRKYRKVEILEFLQNSVKNNNGLNDSLRKLKFNIVDNCIFTVINNEMKPIINTGEFIIENYQVNTYFSYMFLTNLLTNEQYMYYGDYDV